VPKSADPFIGAGAEAEFFKALNAAIAAEDLAETQRQIRAVRSAKPSWLPAREPELVRAEILLAGYRHDASTLIAAARPYLNGDNARSLTIIELAKELRPRAAAEAVLLLKETLRKVPNFTPALRLLSEWENPPESAAASPSITVPTAVP
jgi:hypothetical protein